MWFAFLAVITAKIWVDISKGKSSKTLFDVDSAESPPDIRLTSLGEALYVMQHPTNCIRKASVKTDNAVFETCKTKNQMFLENFSLNGA